MNPGTNGLIIEDEEAQPEGYEDPPALGFGDLQNWGRHYAGATLAMSGILGTDLSFNVLALANLSDLSGVVLPSLSHPFFDVFSVSLGARATFGEPGDEYTNPAGLFTPDDESDDGPTLGLTLTISLQGGSF